MKTISRKFCFTLALIFLLAVALTATLVHPTTVYAINDSRVGWEEGVFNRLDYGIYWYQDGKDIPVKADTVLVHGDGAHAVEFVTALEKAFRENDIQVRPFD